MEETMVEMEGKHGAKILAVGTGTIKNFTNGVDIAAIWCWWWQIINMRQQMDVISAICYLPLQERDLHFLIKIVVNKH